MTGTVQERPTSEGHQTATTSDVSGRRLDDRFDVADQGHDALMQRIDAMGDRLSATIERAFSTAIAKQMRALVLMWVVTVAVIAVLAFGLD